MSEAVALLLAASLRATAVLAGAWAISRLLRRSSASARHSVWACALAVAVLTPVLLQVPPWQVALPNAVAQWVPWMAIPVRDDPIVVERAAVAVDITTIATTLRSVAPNAATPSPATYIAAIWAVGFIAVMVYAFMGAAATACVRRSAARIDASWIDEGRTLATTVGAGRVAFAQSTDAPVPFVCGMINALIVMPSAVSSWDAERRRVVLLHELAHVKRRDCFTHLLGQLACAVYWFHPLSWFAAHRLRVEREQACDDFVLAAGVPGSAYAHHLVDVAKNAFPRRSLLTATRVAMAHRSQLEARLISILDPTTRRTTPRLVRIGAVAFAVCALAAASLRLQAHAPTPSALPVTVGAPNVRTQEKSEAIARAQVPAAATMTVSQPAPVAAPAQSPMMTEPSFEVASIKRKGPGMAGVRFEPGGRFRMEGPLVLLLAVAYEATGPITGGPEWLRRDDYSVEARAAADAPRSEMIKMVRSLVRERLKVAIHRESHEQEAFALVVAKDGQLGPQLRRSTVDCVTRLAAIRENQPVPELPLLPNGMPPCISRPRSGDLVSGGMTLSSLAGYLGGEVGRRVVDKTGLDGYYEMSLRHRDDLDTDPDLPSVVVALSEQLGLKLEPTRTTVETIVVDRIELPTEN